MRPVVIKREKRMQIGSEKAGQRIAAIPSVLETRKRLWVPGRDCMLAVLPQLSYRATRPELRDLTPIGELARPGGSRRARGEEGGALEPTEFCGADDPPEGRTGTGTKLRTQARCHSLLPDGRCSSLDGHRQKQIKRDPPCQQPNHHAPFLPPSSGCLYPDKCSEEAFSGLAS